MKILFDQGTPMPLRRMLVGHEVVTAYEAAWSTLRNGELLAMAEAEGYNLFITTDQNLRYQQNLADRNIAILVISTTSWPRIQKHVHLIRTVVDRIQRGDYREVIIP